SAQQASITGRTRSSSSIPLKNSNSNTASGGRVVVVARVHPCNTDRYSAAVSAGSAPARNGSNRAPRSNQAWSASANRAANPSGSAACPQPTRSTSDAPPPPPTPEPPTPAPPPRSTRPATAVWRQSTPPDSATPAPAAPTPATTTRAPPPPTPTRPTRQP